MAQGGAEYFDATEEPQHIAALKTGDLAIAQALERDLELSGVEINTLRRSLLDHEATHRQEN